MATAKAIALKASAAALALVAPAAFNEAESQTVSIERVKAALNGTRSYSRFQQVRARYIVGRMAARIPSNAETKLRLASAEVAFNSVGLTLVDGKLIPPVRVAKGKRVRTPDEQNAYNAAKQAWSAILKAGNIKSLEKRGAGSDSHKNKRGATGKRVKKAANENKKAAPTYTDKAKIAAFLDQQAAMLASFNNKNAARLTIAERNAIEDFHNAIKAAHAPTE